MKTLKTLASALFLSAAISTAAMAAPAISLPAGPLYIKFDNREQIGLRDTSTGALLGSTGYTNEINWGVALISTINIGTVTGTNVIETTGASFFTNITSHNAQITGIFYAIEASPTTPSAANPFPAKFGYLDLYWRDLDVLSPTDLSVALPGIRTAQDKATGFTEGTLLARLAFASGILSTDPDTYIFGTLNPTPGTGFVGVATSYANVDTTAPGAWSDQLDADWFTTAFGTRDVRFRNIYEELGVWNDLNKGLLGARSTDPATAYAVPEPASLTLFALGLLGIGAARYRRKS